MICLGAITGSIAAILTGRRPAELSPEETADAIQAGAARHYISAKEAGDKWGITPRRVAILCKSGRIGGAFLVGNSWAIPCNAIKPPDGRTKEPKRARASRSVPERARASGRANSTLGEQRASQCNAIKPPDGRTKEPKRARASRSVPERARASGRANSTLGEQRASQCNNKLTKGAK